VGEDYYRTIEHESEPTGTSESAICDYVPVSLRPGWNPWRKIGQEARFLTLRAGALQLLGEHERERRIYGTSTRPSP